MTTEAINRVENQISRDTGPLIGCDEDHQTSSLRLGRVVDVVSYITRNLYRHLASCYSAVH